MNRLIYFNFIEEKLALLATRIEIRGGLNLLELHLHSENFYLQFFNLLFGWKLQNLNAIHQNAAGIDLIDTTNKIIIQVSATSTRQKIESALAKDLSAYKGYSFKFISICRKADDLRSKQFANPHKLIFSPVKDIYDIPSLLTFINGMQIDPIKSIYDFLIKELKSEPDPEKIESNLTTIIQILSKEDWSKGALGFETIPFDIEPKIEFNQLNSARDLIDDHKIHYNRIEKIYSAFDKHGVNKSLSILNGIRSEYISLRSFVDPDQRFIKIIENVIQKIRSSANFTSIPEEELGLCVQILVVDAFIRCKIFKNPSGEANAHS